MNKNREVKPDMQTLATVHISICRGKAVWHTRSHFQHLTPRKMSWLVYTTRLQILVVHKNAFPKISETLITWWGSNSVIPLWTENGGGCRESNNGGAQDQKDSGRPAKPLPARPGERENGSRAVPTPIFRKHQNQFAHLHVIMPDCFRCVSRWSSRWPRSPVSWSCTCSASRS